MNAVFTRRRIAASLRWAAIFVLALVWAVFALVNWVLSRLGRGTLTVAEWALDMIDSLRGQA